MTPALTVVGRNSWLPRTFGRSRLRRRSRPCRNRPPGRVSRFEGLESRLLLATAMLQPSKDNTLIEFPVGNSNGTGELFVGRVGDNQNNSLRRAVVAFDLDSIPAGSTVTGVRLEMSVTRARGASSSVSLQKLTADWGEGTSTGGGRGSRATTNDATWTQRLLPNATWSTAGGDFVSTASATTPVSGANTTPNWSSAGMVTDVQGWLDAPATNFGWILLGDESGGRTVKRFRSKLSSSNQPQLTVTFTEPAVNLSIAIAADSISEGAGAGATTAAITRSGSTANALVVSLSSHDTTEATVATSVTIPAGQATSPIVNIDAVDDNLVDGTQTVTITASATGVNDGTDTVDVTDDDVATLTLSIAKGSVFENFGEGATSATVSRNTDSSSLLVVNLASSDTTEATVQSSATIAVGQATSAPFNINAIWDGIFDGRQTVTITGSASGFVDGSDTVDVLDSDELSFFISIAADAISETAGAGATTATVTRNFNFGDTVVFLTSSDTSEATVQASVTIPAGQTTSPAINIDAVDDALVDGTQTVSIIGTSVFIVSNTENVDVLDNEAPATVTGHGLNGGSANRSGLDSLLLHFSQPVELGTASSVKIWNHTTDSAIDVSGGALLNDGTTEVTLDLSAIAFADGYYTARLPASLGLTETHSFLLHVLAGDSSGNGQVDFSDFSDLANAFNTLSGPIFGPGDLNGDGNVDFGDFGILANGFNNFLTVPAMDFGDAPETGNAYPTTLANDGARHLLGSGLFLGSGVDAEADGQPDTGAAGDDNAGDDEDGVTLPALQAGTSASVALNATVPGALTAVLNAWIDFNRDGDWDDIGEHIFVDQALTNGTNTLTAAIPDAATAGPAFTRFRITTTAGYSYFGLAPDGEVEDYQVTLVAAKGSARRVSPIGPFTLGEAAFAGIPSPSSQKNRSTLKLSDNRVLSALLSEILGRRVIVIREETDR